MSDSALPITRLQQSVQIAALETAVPDATLPNALLCIPALPITFLQQSEKIAALATAVPDASLPDALLSVPVRVAPLTQSQSSLEKIVSVASPPLAVTTVSVRVSSSLHAFVYRIECQARELPHVHILMILGTPIRM